MKFIFAIIVLGLAFIFGLIHPGMEALAAVGSLSPALVALVFYTIKALLKCRAGDNTASVQFSDISVWGIPGAIIMFFYNLIHSLKFKWKVFFRLSTFLY